MSINMTAVGAESLIEDEPLPAQPVGPPVLTVGQQIRLEAARLLLPEWMRMTTNVTDETDEYDIGTVADFAVDVLRLARAIETGCAVTPPAAPDEFQPAMAGGQPIYQHACGQVQLFEDRHPGEVMECDGCALPHEWRPLYVRESRPRSAMTA